jgi:flagellar FliL protein
MAKTPTNPEQNAPAAAPATDQAGISVKKLVIFGVPVFIVQLVIVYFIITKFLAPPAVAGAEPTAHETPEQAAEAVSEEQKIYVVKDLIVNPAGTNGTRFLLTTVGFEVNTGEALKELETKDVQLRDALNTVLTAKGLDELVDVAQRETLRTEISSKVRELVRSGSLKNVYFSKFIIQ